MNVSIFLLCYNERIHLPYTVAHYKKYIPSCTITIYDNESTDGSPDIARELGCNVISWNSGNIIDDHKYRDIKNTCWKSVHDGWVIVCDMDEWLCITEDELRAEKEAGTTIITTRGIDMVGESKQVDLSDINLHEIKKYFESSGLSKRSCFLREKITEINYAHGAHTVTPRGTVVYSKKIYLNKHLCHLGAEFLVDKTLKRHERSVLMRSQGLAIHYTNNVDAITNFYYNALERAATLE